MQEASGRVSRSAYGLDTVGGATCELKALQAAERGLRAVALSVSSYCAADSLRVSES